MAYAVQLADATRHPGRYGLQHLEAADRGRRQPARAIGLVQAGQALALLRGRTHVTVKDIRDLAPDVLRHRLVLSYDAHADRVDSEDIVSEVLEAVQAPGERPRRPPDAPGRRRAARRAGPRPDAGGRGRCLDLAARAPHRAVRSRASIAGSASASARSWPSCARTCSATTSASSTRRPARDGRPPRPPADPRPRADDLGRARPVAVDGVRHRRAPQERRRGGRRARRVAARRAPRGRVSLLTCGTGHVEALPPRGGRRAIGAIRRALEQGVATDGPRRRVTDSAPALLRLRGMARPPGLVVIISDFRDPTDWGRRCARSPRATACWAPRSSTRARRSSSMPGSSCSSTPRTAARSRWTRAQDAARDLRPRRGRAARPAAPDDPPRGRPAPRAEHLDRLAARAGGGAAMSSPPPSTCWRCSLMPWA